MLGSARSAFMKQEASTPPSFPTPIAAYAFSEGSGTTAADSSGNGHNLTLGPATWDTGHTGGGISNTTTGGASSTFSTPTPAATIMGWVKPLDLTPSANNFAFGFVTVDSTRMSIFTQRNIFGNPDVLHGFVRVDGSLSGITGPALTVGTWVHLALSYDGSFARIYVDGTEVNSQNIVGTATTGSDFYVAGFSLDDPTVDSDVVVDDVRVFDAALTEAEIAAAMGTPV